MSEHTKTRRTRRQLGKPEKVRKIAKKPSKKAPFIPWRKALSHHLSENKENVALLRGYRHKMEMTQKELANAIDVKQHHISEMETGKRPIGKEIAQRLAQVFNTDYRIFL